MAFSEAVLAALTRLKTFYSANPVTPANPGGLGNFGHLTNFDPLLKDYADVGAAVGSLAETIDESSASLVLLAQQSSESAAAAVSARDGAIAAQESVEAAVGTMGDVDGPNSAVPGNFAAFDGADGKSIADSGVSPASFATASQGEKADTAIQPDNLATVATTGAYGDLSDTPTLGTAAALDAGTGANQVVQLDGDGKFPAINGSQLTNLPGGGDVSAASNFGTDNRIIRSDGATKGVQGSPVTLNDDGDLTGIRHLTMTGDLTLPQGATPAPTTEGVVAWDTDDNVLAVGDGSGTKLFVSAPASTAAGDIEYYSGAKAKARLAKGTALQVLRMNSGATAPEWGDAAAALTLGTALSTTSGTAKDFTGLPSTAKRLTVLFSGLMLSGTDLLLVQIGDSGGVETSSYTSSSFSLGNTGADDISSTSGFVVRTGGYLYGKMVIEKVSGNKWLNSHVILDESTPFVVCGAGEKTLSGTLDRVRIKPSGSDTFFAGSVNISWE